MKSALKSLIVLILVFSVLFVFFNYYSYIFSRAVTGVVVGVERIEAPFSVIATRGSGAPPKEVFSFSVAIRDQLTTEIVTGSSEDRQWAVVKEGQCATAKFYPHPPWELDKSGTFHGVRLVALFDDCNAAAK